MRGGDEANGAVTPAGRRKRSREKESPGGPCGELPHAGGAAAGVEVVGAPSRVLHDLRDVMREIAVGVVQNRPGQGCRRRQSLRDARGPDCRLFTGGRA